MNIWADKPIRTIRTGFDIVYIRDIIMEDAKIIDPIKDLPNYTDNIQIYNTSRDAFLKELINGNHILQIYEHAKLVYEKARYDLNRKEREIEKLRHQYYIDFWKTRVDKSEVGIAENTIKVDEQARAEWIKTEEKRLFPQAQQAPPEIEGTGGSRIRRTKRTKRTKRSKRTRRSIRG